MSTKRFAIIPLMGFLFLTSSNIAFAQTDEKAKQDLIQGVRDSVVKRTSHCKWQTKKRGVRETVYLFGVPQDGTYDEPMAADLSQCKKEFEAVRKSLEAKHFAFSEDEVTRDGKTLDRKQDLSLDADVIEAAHYLVMRSRVLVVESFDKAQKAQKKKAKETDAVGKEKDRKAFEAMKAEFGKQGLLGRAIPTSEGLDISHNLWFKETLCKTVQRDALQN